VGAAGLERAGQHRHLATSTGRVHGPSRCRASRTGSRRACRRPRPRTGAGPGGHGRSAPRSVPGGRRGPPGQRDVAAGHLASRSAPTSAACASSVLATTSSPEVSRSSRCTMPGRSSPPAGARGIPAPTSASTRVPSGGRARGGPPAGRLGHDEQMLVAVPDRRQRRRGPLGAAGRVVHLDPLAGPEPVLLADRRPRRPRCPPARSGPPPGCARGPRCSARTTSSRVRRPARRPSNPLTGRSGCAGGSSILAGVSSAPAARSSAAAAVPPARSRPPAAAKPT
jgi:hypothetical protein